MLPRAHIELQRLIAPSVLPGAAIRTGVRDPSFRPAEWLHSQLTFSMHTSLFIPPQSCYIKRISHCSAKPNSTKSEVYNKLCTGNLIRLSCIDNFTLSIPTTRSKKNQACDGGTTRLPPWNLCLPKQRPELSSQYSLADGQTIHPNFHLLSEVLLADDTGCWA